MGCIATTMRQHPYCKYLVSVPVLSRRLLRVPPPLNPSMAHFSLSVCDRASCFLSRPGRAGTGTTLPLLLRLLTSVSFAKANSTAYSMLCSRKTIPWTIHPMTHPVYQTIMNHFKTPVGHFLIPLFTNTHESGEKRHKNLRGKLRFPIVKLLRLRLLEFAEFPSSSASEPSSIVVIA